MGLHVGRRRVGDILYQHNVAGDVRQADRWSEDTDHGDCV